MNKIKNKIKNEFALETPDVKEKIITAIDDVTQETEEQKVTIKTPILSIFKKVAFAFSFILIFVLGAFTGYLIPQKQTILERESTVYIDVNPSIEISLSSNETVLECIPINEDAKKILGDMKFNGVNLDTAINAIIGSMYVNGYLTVDENSILISVDSSTKEKRDELISSITTDINKVFENCDIDCNIIAQAVIAEGDIKERAKNNGVSVGKMELIDKLISSYEEFTEGNVVDLSKMSINELNHIFTNKPENEDEKPNEVVTGTVNGYVDKSQILSLILNFLEITEQEIINYDITLKPKFNDKLEVFYEVTLKLKNNEKPYRFEVNCKTGEIEVFDEHREEREKNF